MLFNLDSYIFRWAVKLPLNRCVDCICTMFAFWMIRKFQRSRDSFTDFTRHGKVLIDSYFSHLIRYLTIKGYHLTKYIGIRVEIRKKMGFWWSIVYMDLPLLRRRQVAARVFIIHELWEKDCLKPIFRCTMVNNVIL